MKIGIVGAGNIGGTLGSLWVQAGHDVKFGTRNPANLQALVSTLGPHASSAIPQEAVIFGEVILFAAPYGAWPDFALANAAALAGKVVVDAANPYAQRDGDIVAAVSKAGLGAGGYTARLLPQSRVVKGFNTILWSELRAGAHKAGERLTVPLAGDDKKGVETVSQLARDAGFDPVMIGGLSLAASLDPGSPVYGQSLTAAELKHTFSLR